MEDFEDSEETFHAATEYVKANIGNFRQDTLLKLYGRFKQVKVGPCNTKRPGLFDFQGKQKWDAWNGLGNMSKEQAMQEYIDEVSNVNEDWRSEVSEVSGKLKGGKQQTMLGVSVSTMMNPDCDLDDELKTVFDWCKDGDTVRVSSILDGDRSSVDCKDTEGMTLLHWACDRGDLDMVNTLLKKKANIDLQDDDGQTPLHFAVICEHPEIVRLLLVRNACKTIKDGDGQTVMDLDTTSEIKTILSTAPVR